MKLFIVIFIFLSLYAGAAELAAPRYELQPLRFANRAQCASDSGKPATSAFLLVSNVEAAKAVYRLAKFRGENIEEVTKLGIDKFRYSVTTLVTLIHNKINSRELPLLPADVTREEGHIASNYKNVMKNCRHDGYCGALDDYLAKIWKISSDPSLSSGSKYLKFFKVDNFHSEDSYLTEKDFNKNAPRELNCSYLKKFSPLQAHLFGTKPTRGALEAIADAVATQSEKFAACDDFESQENLQVAGFQIDIPEIRGNSLFRKSDWQFKGFDYWNSMRIYLSYAFRNAPEMASIAYPFSHLFSGITLEESVMLVPNGCKTLAPPKCDGDRLALNSIREFAKEDFRENALELDILSETPNGPDDILVDDMIPSVNIDELDLSAHRTASDWLEKFSGNLSSSRALIKKRLIKGLTHLNTVLKSMPVETLISKLDTQFNGLLSGAKVDALSLTEKNNLYYLCSEFSFSQHEKWSFIRKNLEILKKSKIVDGLTRNMTTSTTEEFFNYFMALGDKVNDACYSLKQNDVWDDDFELEKEGFSPWYTSRVYDNKVESKYDEYLEDYLKENKPLIYYPQYLDDPRIENVICAHASDCARKTIQSILSLYSATQYASTFWSLEQKVKSPDLFNPYVERTACKVYDPWFKTRSTLFGFLWDMGQAAASAFVPGMIYTKADLQPRMVTSFNQLVKDGVIEYDANFKKEKILLALTADFGPLTGVPCALSLNRSPNNPMDMMRFTGITVGACNSDTDYNLNVYSAGDIRANDSNGHSECLSCSLNFESVSGVLAHATQNVGPVYFLVRGLYRLYKAMKDPHNIPRSWEVNPLYASETKALYGEIPKSCVRSLRKGKRCLNPCEEDISEEIENLPGSIINFQANKGRGSYVVHSACPNEKITFSASLRSSDSSGRGSCRVKKVYVPKACRGQQ